MAYHHISCSYHPYDAVIVYPPRVRLLLSVGGATRGPL